MVYGLSGDEVYGLLGTAVVQSAVGACKLEGECSARALYYHTRIKRMYIYIYIYHEI